MYGQPILLQQIQLELTVLSLTESEYIPNLFYLTKYSTLSLKLNRAIKMKIELWRPFSLKSFWILKLPMMRYLHISAQKTVSTLLDYMRQRMTKPTK